LGHSANPGNGFGFFFSFLFGKIGLLVNVVVVLIVAGEGDQAPDAQSVGEENLGDGIDPDLSTTPDNKPGHTQSSTSVKC